jgi:hypothetical protein
MRERGPQTLANTSGETDLFLPFANSSAMWAILLLLLRAWQVGRA